MRKYAIVICLVLAGCAVFSGADTPAKKVFALQATYNSVLAAAVAYETQPRCSDTVKQPCSDPDVVQIIRKADDAAHIALRAAQNVVRTPGATDTAINLALATAAQSVEGLRAAMKQIGVD